VTSGLRLGTAAVATRDMKEPEMDQIADWIHRVLDAEGDAAVCGAVRKEVDEVCHHFPIYEWRL
jgi:glycine hydroxymethyltransferase